MESVLTHGSSALDELYIRGRPPYPYVWVVDQTKETTRARGIR
jgi:hypothetical protein